MMEAGAESERLTPLALLTFLIGLVDATPAERLDVLLGILLPHATAGAKRPGPRIFTQG